MPPVCIVRGCGSVFCKGTNLKFHKPPKDEELRRQWIEICGATKYSTGKSPLVCSRHFAPSAYARNLKYELLGIPVPSRLVRFKPGTVPTLRLPNSEGSTQPASHSGTGAVAHTHLEENATRGKKKPKANSSLHSDHFEEAQAPEGRSADTHDVTPAPLLVLLQPSYSNMPNEAMLEGVASGSGFVAGNAASYCLPSQAVSGASFSLLPSSSFPCISSSTFPSSSLTPPSCSGTDEAAVNEVEILGIESVDSVSPSSSPYPFYSSEEIVKEEEEIDDTVDSVSVPFSHTPHGTIREGIAKEKGKMDGNIGSSVPSSHYPYDTDEEQIVKEEEEMDESVGYVCVASPHYSHYKSEEEIVKQEEEVNASNEDTEQEFLCGSKECEDPDYEMPENDASDDESLFCFVGISSQDNEKPATMDS